ncbi:hypothetical protein NTE_01160 [Candidatus Nitrososphaera evergladensis SR1]|uniref:Uncharacterized protein n=2 Tax=Nitrososphaera TaxID=497726 RepID=A0A075MPY1_9ARCH|nr:hypothetical protein NTE_01160 [Candidatus Nitrososphaera evergladensis SR1]
MWQDLLLVWGCMPELTRDCQDMTNASSTYLRIVIGAIIGGIVGWWIYNRQKKTADEQDATLERIKRLDERHDNILKRLEEHEKDRDATLNRLLELDKKIQRIVEKQDKIEKSIQSALKEKGST